MKIKNNFMNGTLVLCLILVAGCTYLESSNLGNETSLSVVEGNSSVILPRIAIESNDFNYQNCTSNFALKDDSLVFNTEIIERKWEIIDLSPIIGISPSIAPSNNCTPITSFLIYEGSSPREGFQKTFEVKDIQVENDFVIKLTLTNRDGVKVSAQSIFSTSNNDTTGTGVGGMFSTGEAFVGFKPEISLINGELKVFLANQKFNEAKSTNGNSEQDIVSERVTVAFDKELDGTADLTVPQPLPTNISFSQMLVNNGQVVHGKIYEKQIEYIPFESLYYNEYYVEYRK